MSLMDRNRRVVTPGGLADATRRSSKPAKKSKRPEAQPAASTPSAGAIARGFLNPERQPSLKPGARDRMSAVPGGATGRSIYVLATLVVSAALAIGIGSTGSPLLAAAAFAIACSSALLTMFNRPASVRALYARFPGAAVALHAALAIGALAVWGDAPQHFTRLRVQAAARAAERRKAEEDFKIRSALHGKVHKVNEELLERVIAARAAMAKKDWDKTAAALAEAVVIVKPYQDANATALLNRDVMKALEEIAVQAARGQREQQARDANAKIEGLLDKARADKADDKWLDAKAAVDEALATQQTHEHDENALPLDSYQTRRAAASAREIQSHLEEAAAKQAALNEVQQLQTALEQGTQLARAKRWTEAETVYQALSEALTTLTPEVEAQWPQRPTLEQFKTQVAQRATEASKRATQARKRGP